MPLALSTGASARVLFLRLATLTPLPRVSAMSRITLNRMSADVIASSTRSLITASPKMKEILKNGPVVAQMVVYTDFLTYKEGIYHRTEDAFRFNGQQIVKIVGWDKQGDGQEFWLVENSWGEDWGEQGYVRVLASDKSTQLDFYALGVAAYPYTMAEYYTMQEEMQKRGSNSQTGSSSDDQDIDLDSSTQSSTEKTD